MEVIFSLSAWCNFIFERLLLDAIFVPVAILILFAVFNRKEYRNTNMLRFILTALVLTLLSRYIFFVSVGTKINTRYLYTTAFYVIILCAPGFFLLVRLLKYLTKKIIWIKEKHLIIFLVMVIGIACIGKALHPPDRKHYIHDTAKIIKNTEASENSIIISNIRGARRVAWHSRAQFVPLSQVTDIENPANLENALKILGSKSNNIFLLVKFKDVEFRKLFSDKKIKFPAKLIFLKEFKAKHKTFYSLYQIETR